ncbi:bis(5'-nucleosyl)-tetraphosphatase (symmetrical) YqeK [Lentibacillus saliphilus]|uniref:bis(5'-nucleosyl)-tetraphosphatase (symmetrical) YqeK n=1 Tax=Lentibacillus saliphilus TaxID=2737028 RepID=UPI001C2FF728|nr:bis(5'-nucleosyl)-tetraphosphatase (symmetrical) YqeK [Lentibacillus saliphilus]
MNRDEAIRIVKPQLTDERFEHTLRVADTALELSECYGVSSEQAEEAALLHDYAKYRPVEEMKRWIKSTTLPKDLLHFHSELWHAPVGAKMLELEHGITDQSVLDAVAFHTTGRVGMTSLDMIIFIADYIEPGRSFPGVGEVRAMAKQDIRHACWLALRNTISFLLDKQSQIYPNTFYAYNDLTNYVKGGH